MAILVGSVLNALASRLPDLILRLSPALVLEGHGAYELLTYCFVAGSPMGVIFSCLIAWSLGSSLEQAWGSRRLWLFAVGVTVLAGAITVGLARVPGMAGLLGGDFEGAPALTSALWVAEGWRLGRRPTSFWGLSLTGNQFALIGVGFIGLNAVFSGVLSVLPDFLAVGLTYLYVIGWSPRLLVLRFQSWRLQRQLRGRARHLKLVDDASRNTPRDSDRYLH